MSKAIVVNETGGPEVLRFEERDPGKPGPGQVRVAVRARKPRYLRGEVTELLAPGPARVDPVCAAFGSCGGCSWQHVDYPAQLEAKVAIVRDALTRLAGVEAGQVAPAQCLTDLPRSYADVPGLYIGTGR